MLFPGISTDSWYFPLFAAISYYFYKFRAMSHHSLLFPFISRYVLWFHAISGDFVPCPAVLIGLKWVLKILSKSTRNQSKNDPQIGPKSLKNRPKIAPKWHPGAGVHFEWFFVAFWTPFWTHFGPIFDPKMTSKTCRKSHAKMSRKRYAFGRFKSPFWGQFLLHFLCIFRTLSKHRFWACVLHVSFIFRATVPSKNTVFLQ